MTTASQSEPTRKRAQCVGSEVCSGAIRVTVRPRYEADQSDPNGRNWLFSYRVRVVNEGAEPVQLMSRRWEIVDAHGQTEQVAGPGVVGRQPRLDAGQSFEYSSFCQLRTNWGTMEGAYQFRTDDARPVEALVGRFFLVGPEAPRR